VLASRLTIGSALILLGTCSLAPAQAPQAPLGDNKCRLETLETALKRKRQMPDVTGCTFETVNAILHRFDYPPTKNDVPSTDPTGQIVNQSPSAGVPLANPVHIVLAVSNGVVPVDPVVTADISVRIDEMESERPYTSGQSVKYGIFIANVGPSVATNIRVDDTPTNLKITGVSGACNSFPCEIVDLNPDSTASIFVTAVIAGDGAFKNEAVATHAERDPNPTNDSASSGGNATSSVDISVTSRLKTLEEYRPGDTAVFISEVHNTGPSTALDVRVISRLTNLTFTGVSGGCTALNCVIPNIEPGKSVEVVMDATIDSNGAFEDTVAVSSDQNDLDLSNNSATFVGSTTISSETKGSVKSGVALSTWMWVAGAVVLLTVLAAATQSVRKARWRGRISVSPSLDRVEVSPVPDLHAMSGSQVTIRARLEMGTAGPKGAVPIVREAVEDD
jgi:uncharacterized repeat protein (TIGR01451 family)